MYMKCHLILDYLKYNSFIFSALIVQNDILSQIKCVIVWQIYKSAIRPKK